MTTKTWIIFGIIVAVLFGGLLVWSGRDRIDVSKVNENTILSSSKVSGDIADHVKGNKDAKVILIEYGDFQCPGCGAAYPRVKSLIEKHSENIAVVFRNFPLTNIHPNARAAAAAAEAAGLQGKYWEMHDILFESQDAWSDASTAERGELFNGYAKQIGLDTKKFSSNLSDLSARLNQKISFDQALGRKLDVTGTPTFFLNGTKMTEDQTGSDESFIAAVEAELEKQGVSIETTETTKE